jgi:ribosome-binding factor A
MVIIEQKTEVAPYQHREMVTIAVQRVALGEDVARATVFLTFNNEPCHGIVV